VSSSGVSPNRAGNVGLTSCLIMADFNSISENSSRSISTIVEALEEAAAEAADEEGIGGDRGERGEANKFSEDPAESELADEFSELHNSTVPVYSGINLQPQLVSSP